MCFFLLVTFMPIPRHGNPVQLEGGSSSAAAAETDPRVTAEGGTERGRARGFRARRQRVGGVGAEPRHALLNCGGGWRARYGAAVVVR